MLLTLHFAAMLIVCITFVIPIAAAVRSVHRRSIHDTPDMMKISIGREVSIKNYPFLVSIQLNEYHMCGGSLFRTDWVLTAAHCLLDDRISKYPTLRLPSRYTVIAGLDVVDGVTATTRPRGKRDATSSAANRRAVATTHVHEKYSPLAVHNDIGLMRLSSSFELSEAVQLATLPSPVTLLSSATCQVAGWGEQVDELAKRKIISRRSFVETRVPTPVGSDNTTGSDASEASAVANLRTDDVEDKMGMTRQRRRSAGTSTTIPYGPLENHASRKRIHLQDVTVYLLHPNICTFYFQRNVQEDRQLCADEFRGGVCKGDSGGTLICQGCQMGITSFAGSKHCDRNMLTVYTRVDHYLDWINMTVAATATPLQTWWPRYVAIYILGRKLISSVLC